MAVYRLSVRAEGDLRDIAHYTLWTWGEEQTNRYLDDLEACCQKLADHPGLGRVSDYIRRGLRRLEHGSHVIFYRQEAEGVLISRILHQRMMPGLRQLDEEDR